MPALDGVEIIAFRFVEIGLCYGWVSGRRKSFDERLASRGCSPR